MEIQWGADREQLTAAERTVLEFAETTPCGIYAAWARVCDGPDQEVYKVAMSVGWNPTFEGSDALKEKTIEAWLLHDFANDFYDATIRIIVLAYVRDEAKFESLDELIAEIRADGDYCARALDAPTLARYKLDPFFCGRSSTTSITQQKLA
ncbi:hypothetical protein CTAYLR_007385 [Chrysophaeum taylorii]|uniref:riboflavin kinase n=1 Tax=Chrysophaeum taylorii TaxID=2483200 RepID=A0AAD7XJ92_9STRA|nr:hypothetical protein CTAYLR_007385 [Chrysophaeum taylorii]